jgi:hypothetical protein
VEPLLADLQQKNALTSNTDQDYVDMMEELVKIKIPREINITEKADSLPFFVDKNNINLGVLSEISGKEYSASKSDLYVDAILSWNLNNLDMNINFREFSGAYEFEVDRILSTFEIDIAGNPARDNAYFIVPSLKGIKFKENYGELEKSGYYYLEIDQNQKNIGVSTTEEIDLFSLPVFFSPEIGRFSSVEFTEEEREKLSRQTILVLSLFLVLFLGFISYLIMQEWYKRKYESYLFKNRNDLYNLISYIHHAEKKDVDKNEIYSKLKKIGWSSEQVKYVIRKYAGKRTGMLEIIPFEKIFSKFTGKSFPPQRESKFHSNTKI